MGSQKDLMDSTCWTCGCSCDSCNCESGFCEDCKCGDMGSW